MTDQVWFITGSSWGLGRAVAEEALAAGRTVVATARRTSTLDDLAGRYGDRLLALPLDVTDPEQASAAVTRAVERFGRIDVVVNNAGYANIAPVEEVSLSQFAQGRPICHRPGESRWFDPHEVVRRARMRLGENRYNVLTNNCEHFCEWCVRGEHRSYQVDDIIARCSRTWRGLAEVLVR